MCHTMHGSRGKIDLYPEYGARRITGDTDAPARTDSAPRFFDSSKSEYLGKSQKTISERWVSTTPLRYCAWAVSTTALKTENYLTLCPTAQLGAPDW